MSYEQWQESDSAPWSKVNENMESLGQAFVFGERQEGHGALTVGYHGGTFDGNTVADGSVAGLTDDATNYLVVHRSTRAVSADTATTNWNDTATYGRMARAVFASGVLTWHDERRSLGGIFDHGAGGVAAADVSFTSSNFGSSSDTVAGALEELRSDIDNVVASGAAPIDSEAGSSRTILQSDAGYYIRFTGSGAKTCTFDDAEGLDAPQEYHIANRASDGNVTLVGDGITLNAPKGGSLVLEPGDTVTVKMVSTAEADVFGSTEDAS